MSTYQEEYEALVARKVRSEAYNTFAEAIGWDDAPVTTVITLIHDAPSAKEVFDKIASDIRKGWEARNPVEAKDCERVARQYVAEANLYA